MSEEPNQFIFHFNEDEVFRIKPDGDVVINPKYNVTDAAHCFWKAVLALQDDYFILNASEII